MLFLDGPGGTGKSYVLETILADVRQDKRVAIAVAASGIAVLLLTGGRTAHSRFHLGLKFHGNSTCFMTADSPSGRLLKAASLIVWDEAPMQHRHAFEAVDRTLRELMQTPHIPFGGKVVVLAGDFRQILPVVMRGGAGKIIGACIQRSRLWPDFQILRLQENMRIKTAKNPTAEAELKAFSSFLLEIGEGRHQVDSELGADYCRIPKSMVLDAPAPGVSPGSQLIEHVYGDIRERYTEPTYFADRAILGPWNAGVDNMNDKVLAMLPVKTAADEYTYLSHDTVAESEDSDNTAVYSTEFLNSLSFGGLPPHKLHLKVGAIVMLLRNLQGGRGLCNGTRLQVCRVHSMLIDAMILNGRGTGNRVIIPRLDLTSSDGKLPFQLTRHQLPVKLAFAMTVHKAQGQTIPNLGLFLPRPVFTHGQLYVALSRVSSADRVKIAIQNPVKEDDEAVFTKNIVYRDVIRQEPVLTQL